MRRAAVVRFAERNVKGVAACGLALAAAGLLAGGSQARSAAARPGGVDLKSALRTLVALPGGPPGLIVIVQRPGHKTVYFGGSRQLGAPGFPRVFDRMRLASASKAFSGAVALSLVAKRSLRLSDTIGKWLPKLPRAWRRVTLAEALQHTSGLPDFSAAPAFTAYLQAHPHATPPPLFVLRLIARQRLLFAPGSRYHYSNTDNFIVALMAEAATHGSYNQLLASEVYKPLGLRHTSLPRGAGLPAPYLHGYAIDPPQPPEDVSSAFSAAFAWASGGLVSTPGDMNAFIRGYASGRLFGPSVQRQQLRFVAGNSDPIGPGANSAGLGIFRYRTRCGTVYGHTGNTPGYTQFAAATLDGRRSVTVSISEQIGQISTGPRAVAFRRLRQVEADAVCAAMS